MQRTADLAQLRSDAAEALERGQLSNAIELYRELEAAESNNPAWPKKIGEIYRRDGKPAEAITAFERAADRYVLAGFLVQALAVCKLILQLDPEHSATQLRLAAIVNAPAPRATRETPVARTPSRELPADAGVHFSTPRVSTRERLIVEAARSRVEIAQARTSTRERLAAEAARSRAELAADPTLAVPRTSTRERELAAEAARARGEVPTTSRTSTRERLAAEAARSRAELAADPAPVPRTTTRERLAAEAARSRAELAAADPSPVPRTTTRERLAAEAARSRAELAGLSDPRVARTSTRERELAAEAARARGDAPTTPRTITNQTVVQIPPRTTPPTQPPTAAAPRHTPPTLPPLAPQPAPTPTPTPTVERRATRPRHAPSLPPLIAERIQNLTIEIPPGGGLDQIDLSGLIPGATPVMYDDGSYSGVHVLPLGDDDMPEITIEEGDLTALSPGIPAHRALLTTPLFPQVPPHVLEHLILQMKLVVLEPEQVLFREGETGHELFVISEGEVVVESQGSELARLGPSAFFGEIALVTDLPRSATIRAVDHVELLAIDRGVIREASKDNPEVVTVLLRFVRDRLIDRITRTSDLFRPFDADERRALSARFELVEVVPEAVLITQGERADGLYLVVAGKVEVWRDGEGTLATLTAGDVFGELSLLAGGGSTANVRAITKVLALRMPAGTFHQVIMTHPQVLAYLGELAQRRTPRATASEFADLHLDMLV